MYPDFASGAELDRLFAELNAGNANQPNIFSFGGTASSDFADTALADDSSEAIVLPAPPGHSYTLLPAHTLFMSNIPPYAEEEDIINLLKDTGIRGILHVRLRA